MVLEGRGLRLVPLVPALHAPALHAVYGDELGCRYLSRPPFASVDETRAQLEQYASQGSELSWVVEQDGEVVGRVALIERRDGVLEAAVLVVPQVWGTGVATRALEPALTYGFSRGAHRIQADIDPENIGSIRVFEKLGFQLEGHLRQTWRTHLGLRDSLMYALLSSDPRPT